MLSRGRLTSPPPPREKIYWGDPPKNPPPCLRAFYPSRKRKNALHSRNIILNPSFVTFKQAENILMSYSLVQGLIDAWWGGFLHLHSRIWRNAYTPAFLPYLGKFRPLSKFYSSEHTYYSLTLNIFTLV